MLRTWPAIHDPVEQAARWYFVAQQGFGGLFGHSWGASVDSTAGGMASTVSRWRSSFDNLPYVPGCRKSGGYEHELQNADHEELIETLMRYDGAVVLSGYDNNIYAPLLKAGWDMLKIEVCCTAAGRTRASWLQGAGKVLAKQRRTECVWRNPEAIRRIREPESVRSRDAAETGAKTGKEQ